MAEAPTPDAEAPGPDDLATRASRGSPGGAPDAGDREGVRTPRDPSALIPVVLAAMLCWGLLAAGLSQLRRRTVPLMPDLWETVLATSSAAHGAQRVGAWSRLGFFHPGPLWFYWAAPFYAASGSKPASLPFAVAVLGAACIVGIVVRTWRTADATAATVAVAILAIGVHQLGIPGLVAPWNPTVLILPLALGLVCTADALERGSVSSIATAVLCGSFVAQCHLGTFAIGGAVVLAALVGGLLRRRKLAAEGGPHLRARHWAVLAIALVVPWVPPLIDQVAGTGNLGSTATYFRTGHGPAGSLEGIGANLTPGAALEQLGSIHSLSSSGIASWAGVAVALGRDHEPTVANDATFGILLAFGLLGATRRRSPSAGAAKLPEGIARGRQLGIQLCRTSLVATAMFAISAVRISSQFRPYLLAGAAGAGLALWLGVALVALAAARSRFAGARAVVDLAATGLAAIVAIVIIATTSTKVIGFGADPEPTPTVAAIAAEAGDHGVILAPAFEHSVPKSLKVAWELERRGVRVGARGPFDDRFSDRQRRFHDPEAIEVHVVTLTDEVPTGCDPVGAYGDATLCVVR